MEIPQAPSINPLHSSTAVPIGDPDFLQQIRFMEEAALEAILRTIQLRLGTPEESHKDFDHARIVAHELNNLITIRRLNEALRNAQG